MEGATAEGWKVAATRTAVAEYGGPSLAASAFPAAASTATATSSSASSPTATAAFSAAPAATSAAAAAAAASAAAVEARSGEAATAATLTLVASKNGKAEPCKQVREARAGAAAPPPIEQTTAPCAAGAECVELRRRQPAPGSVLAHNEAAPLPGKPPRAATLADLPPGGRRDRRLGAPLDAALAIGATGGALQPPQHTAMNEEWN